MSEAPLTSKLDVSKSHHSMQGPLELSLAWRYFRSRRSNGFVSFIAFVSLLGIMLGIASLIVVISVMNGFGNDLRERILGSSTHLVISPDTGGSSRVHTELSLEQIKSLLNTQNPEAQIAPYAKGIGMLANKDKLGGVTLHGIHPEFEDSVTQLSSRMLIGKTTDLLSNSDKLLIGDSLAIELGLGLNDEVTLILPQSQAQSADLTPKLRRYRIGGIFHFDHPQINRRDVYMHKSDLLRLQSKSTQTQGFRVRLQDPFLAPDLNTQLSGTPELSNFKITDWTKEQASIFRAVKMEKTVMFILLLLIVAVAAFNIVSTLMMVVKDKRHDIAIFRTLGMTPNSVTRIFFSQGLFIGMIGTFAGVVLGVVVTINVNVILPLLEKMFGFSLFPKDLMLIQGLPYEIQVSNIIFTVVVALLLTAMASIYPARKAALVEPGEALRYD